VVPVFIETEARADRLFARLAQLVRAVTGSEKGLQVQLLVEGKKVSSVFPGRSADHASLRTS